MYHAHEYPHRKLDPIWEGIMELIKEREYKRARERMKYFHIEVNRIITIMEKMYPTKDTRPQQRKQTYKKI